MAGMSPIFNGEGRPASRSSIPVTSVGEEVLLALAGGFPRGVCGAGRFEPFLGGVGDIECVFQRVFAVFLNRKVVVQGQEASVVRLSLSAAFGAGQGTSVL